MSYPTLTGDAVEGILLREPQVDLGPNFANATYQFYLTDGVTPANVYQDGALTTPFPTTGLVQADNFGRFPPIYLDTSVTYAVQLTATGYSNFTNPYVPPLATVGTSALSAYGINIATTGEITLPAPNSGGTGVTLTLNAGILGTAALKISSVIAGQPALIINSSATTGAQTATFTATNKPGTATSSPAGWLPIQCDGTIYYAPIWHGNNFTPYVSNPGAIGETINAASVVFNGNGSTTATGGTALPGSWYLPNVTGIGTSYYIQITKTSGLSGLAFSTGSAVTNITSGGLTVTSNADAQIVGTYIISTSATGSPVVASGTIQLQGGNGPISNPGWDGAQNLILGPQGTASLNGVPTTNWYAPSTAGIGAGYYITVIQTGGTAGCSFSGVSSSPSAPTNISSGGLTISINNGSVTGNFYVTGNFTIYTSSSGGSTAVAVGSVTLTGSSAGNPVQSPNWSGGATLVLQSNGGSTLTGSSSSDWYTPHTTNIGNSYWLNITRTGGTSGVNFSKAQGSWVNIGSGLTIDISGYSGVVGTATASGNWQISSSSGGSPVWGSGTISLSRSGLTLIHVYTSGSNATETVPSGSTTAILEVWGGGAGGTPGTGSGCSALPGNGGGAGGYSRTSFPVSTKNGKTWKYTTGVGGGAGANGSAGSITAGTITGFTTMTANGGSTTGAGGTASGGTQANTTGNAGSGRTGGAGVKGNVSGDGSPYGGGGAGGTRGAGNNGGPGGNGAAVFYYS
jgi:hypothetical protein